MKKSIYLLAVLACFLFPSCEMESLEPEINTGLGLDAVVKANNNNWRALSFRAHLSGDQEVPPVETRATGQAIFKLSKDGSELTYKLIVANIENVTMAHIHFAPAGQNGDPVVWLYPDTPPPVLIEGRTNGILAQGVITSENITDMTLEVLLANMAAGNTYVNVHTSEFTRGEIRGQISGNK